ncbi:MAG TPA: hypothetical protein VIM29_00660 [Bacillota bacterium]
MGCYSITVKNSNKPIFAEHLRMGGTNPVGKRLGVNNYYLEQDGKPFFGISGELHFSRLDQRFWEDEIIKMKQQTRGTQDLL